MAIRTNYELRKIEVREIIQRERVIYSKERIEELYYQYYLNNLKRLLLDKNLDFRWYSVDEIEPMESKIGVPFTQYPGDSYLREMPDERKLALDVMENGTYWPLTIAHTEKVQNLAFKGSHRVISAKMLQSEGLWNGRKFLAIDLIRPTKDEMWEFYSRKQPLDGNDIYCIPMLVLYPDLYSENIDHDIVRKDLEAHGGKYIEHDIAEIRLRNYRDLMKTLSYWSIWIRELMHISKDAIKPSIVINSEEAFERWREESLRELGV